MQTQNSAIELYRELVMLDGDAGYTTSRKIASRFKRPHHSVLKSIDRINGLLQSRKIQVTDEMFRDHSYIDSRGKIQREFLANKDGFILLAMRFDGEEAFEWQLNFIAAFNWLVCQVREREENSRLMAQFDIKSRASIADGSYHGKGLQQRKVDKCALEIEEATIKARAQATIDFDKAEPSQVH